MTVIVPTARNIIDHAARFFRQVSRDGVREDHALGISATAFLRRRPAPHDHPEGLRKFRHESAGLEQLSTGFGIDEEVDLAHFGVFAVRDGMESTSLTLDAPRARPTTMLSLRRARDSDNVVSATR